MDQRADALYALPQQEFVAARDALVKELRAAGDKELAAEVKALARPTLAAWALNQVARETPKEVEALLDVGERLRGAQRAALGGAPSGLVAASADRHRLVSRLARLAGAALESGGYAAPSHEEGITRTLEAAVIDPDTGTALRDGRLTHELASTGLDLLLTPGPFEAPARGATRKAAAAAKAPAQPTRPSVEVERPPARADRESARAAAKAAVSARAAELAEAAEAARARAAEAAQEAEAAQARAADLAAEAEAAAKDARRARGVARDAVAAATAAEAAARQAAGRASRGTR